MKIYGLFEYTYDWYEWEQLIVVSRNVEKLKKYYETYKGEYGKFLLVEESEHKDYAKDQHNHMIIREVQVV